MKNLGVERETIGTALLHTRHQINSGLIAVLILAKSDIQGKGLNTKIIRSLDHSITCTTLPKWFIMKLNVILIRTISTIRIRNPFPIAINSPSFFLKK